MTTGSELNAAQPPRAALEWAARAAGPGARVVRARLLLGGGWHANHLVELELLGGRRLRLVLRCWARPGWDLDDPDMTAAREASILQRLEQAGLSTPRLIAVDATGSEAGVPALLETVVPGIPIRRPRDPIAFARALAEPLIAIHAVPVEPAADAASIPYRRYYDPTTLVAPAWAADRRPWERAIEVASKPLSDTLSTFIHRDYHPGNALWSGGRLTGIVDWTGASWGPPAADLAHLHARDVDRLALARYHRLGGRELGLHDCRRGLDEGEAQPLVAEDVAGHGDRQHQQHERDVQDRGARPHRPGGPLPSTVAWPCPD